MTPASAPHARARALRRVVAPALAAAALLVLGGALLAVLPPKRTRLEPTADPRSIRGSLHVHTVRSDGTGTPEAVAKAAAAAGLQFVVLSDHGDATRTPDPPVYRSGVLCLDAVEISADGGHYLALGLGRAPYRLAGEPRDVIDDVARLGGFGIVAHPASPKADLRWRDWIAPFDGIEWLNADSEWRDETRGTLLRALASYGLRAPETIASVFDRPVPVLDRWDRLAVRRRVIATAGHDAHARIGLRGNWEPSTGEWSLRLPSYEAAFRAFAVRIALEAPLSGDPVRDARTIVEMIRRGRIFTVIDAVAGPAALRFRGRVDGRVVEAGDDLETTAPVDLEAEVTDAPGLTLALLRNGEVVDARAGHRMTFRHEPRAGVTAYRVEARLQTAPGQPPVPWILGNPIWIGASLPRVPARAPRPGPDEWRTIFDGSTLEGWRVERDPVSTGALALVESGRDHELRFAFGLRAGSVASQYAAAVLEAGRPTFGDADRVSFRARSARPMRLSVQLRDPASGRRWRRSVVLDVEPAEHTVFLDDLTALEPVLAGPLPRAALDSLLFVVDTVHTRPGTAGTVWIDDVRLGLGTPGARAVVRSAP